MSSSSQAGDSWISAFCSLVGHEYFAEVSEDFIEDDFNLTGLQSQVPMYKDALEMILDVEPETDEYTGDEDEEDEGSLNSDNASLQDDGGQHHSAARMTAAERRHARIQSDYSVIESSAEMLYGLIHQRFITSRQGIQQMLEKYEIGHFGSCPRVYCRGAKVLPVGTSDIPGQDTVKLFCPACLDVYAPPNSRFQAVDGAFFGTTFGCLFFMTFPEVEVAGTRALEHGGASTPHAIPPPASSATGANGESQPQEARKAARNIGGGVEDGVINGVAAHNLAPGLGQGSIFEPRIYGFRVSEFAKSGPRMKWLRQKPTSLAELDEVAIWQISHGEAAEDEEDEDEDEEDYDEDEELEDEEEECEEAESRGDEQGDGGILEGGEEGEPIEEDDEEEDEDVGEAIGEGTSAAGVAGGAAQVASRSKGKKNRQRDTANGEIG